MILAGAARAWSDFDTANALTYVFVGGLAALIAGLIALDVYMNGLQRHAAPHGPARAV